MQKQNVNEYDEVVGFMRDALRAVREAEIPEHLQQVAFGHACQFVSAQVAVQHASPLALPDLARH